MRIVVDNQNAPHAGFSCRIYASNRPGIDCAMIFSAANQCVILICASMR